MASVICAAETLPNQASLLCENKQPGSYSEDRRITRSKKAFRTALIVLMEQRGFDAITVNDLCAVANLNRGTFYNHFHDKDELLTSLEDEVMANIARIQAKMENIEVKDIARYRFANKPPAFLIELFDYLRQESDFLHAVLGSGGDIGFGPRLRDSVCTYLIHSILHEQYRSDSDPFVGYYVAFYSSAYLGVIARWIETGMEETSEQMAQMALRLLFIRPGEPIKL